MRSQHVVQEPQIGGTRLRSLLLPTAAAVIGIALLVGLGVWQLHRKVWKEGLIADLNARGAAAPVPLPPPSAWATLNPAHDEFRRVSFEASFLNGDEARVYSAGSALRTDISGPGYFIFTPARLPDGRLIMVNRGYVPVGRQDPKTRPQGQIKGEIRIVGALRWPEQPGWFSASPDLKRDVWYVRNIASMAKSKGLGPVAPFYVAQESPVPPGGLPKPGPLKPHLRNKHLQYAMTWFGIAIVLAGVFISWAVVRWRGGTA